MLEKIVQTPLSWRPVRLKKHEGESTRASQGNIKALDGVRAIAALLVVSLHLNKGSGAPWDFNSEPLSSSFAVFGRTGVVLFFILSGFLLFRPYAQALVFQEKWPSVRTFYLRRIFRIWPAYYFTLFAMIMLFERQYLQPEHWKELALFLTFFMDSSMKTWQRLDGPFWTLAIEWQFYIVLPWLALGFAQIIKRVSSTSQQRLKATFVCCSGLILWGLAIRFFGHYCQANPNFTILVPRSILNFLLFFTYGIQGKYLEVFALGMLASTCYVYAHHPESGPAFKERLENLSYWAWGIGILILACMSPWQAEATRPMNGVFSTVHAFPFLDQFQFQYMVFGDLITAVGYSLCMLAILFGPPALRWVFETRFLYLIGMISFSLYMWHLKMLGIFQVSVLPYVPHLARRLSYWLWVFLVIVPFCYILYIFIERPGMRIGALLTSSHKSPTPQPFIARLKYIFSPSKAKRSAG